MGFGVQIYVKGWMVRDAARWKHGWWWEGSSGSAMTAGRRRGVGMPVKKEAQIKIQAVAKIQYPIKSHITKAKGVPVAVKAAGNAFIAEQ